MTGQDVQFVVEQAGERLDKLVAAQFPVLSRMQVQAMIKAGDVQVDGNTVKPGVKLHGGETVTVTLPGQVENTALEPEAIPLEVVYEDDALAVVDKPAGMVVHPGVGNATGTLVHAILARWPQIAAMPDPDHRKGIVHRLDKDTSGLILVAKTADALQHLMHQFQARTVEKRYIALLERTPKTRQGRIEAPIGRDPKQRKKMAVIHDGKPAVTEFAVLDDAFRDEAALVEFRLLTGRTHQIRVHAAFIGCPVVGDRVYGFRKQRTRMKRHFLHAAHMTFSHPVTGESMHFESPLPVVLQDLLGKLR